MYDFTIMTARVKMDISLLSVRITEPCACFTELKIEFELELVISMQLRNKITVARNIRIHHLSLLKQSTKCSCSQFRGCGRNGKNNTQSTGKTIQLLLHGIRFISEY